MNAPTATVVITTKNRKEDLRTAVISALAQDAKPEVLVIDDGSTDGSSDMLRAEFPQVRLERSETSLGLIVQRNRAAALATAPIIFSIDDDAAFSTDNIVSQTLGGFDHPRVGAVAIPYIDVRLGSPIHQRAADDHDLFVAPGYIGTAHALRRDLFLRLGGYRAQLFRQCEERDYCLRMLEAGYVVRLGRADPVHHFVSPKRESVPIIHYGRRNDVLFVWHNVPFPYFPLHLIGTMVHGLDHGLRTHQGIENLRGILRGLGACPGEWKHRKPVRIATYRLFRQISRAGWHPLSEILAQLPAIKEELKGTEPFNKGSCPCYQGR